MGKGRKSRKQSGRKPERFYLYFGSEIFGDMCDRKRKAIMCIQFIGSRNTECRITCRFGGRDFRKALKQARWLEIFEAKFYNKKDVNHSHGRVIRKAKEAEKKSCQTYVSTGLTSGKRRT